MLGRDTRRLSVAAALAIALGVSAAVAFDPADTCYFGFIDDVATTTSIAKTIKFVGVTECIARARFSSPAFGGQRILPFELLNVQVTDADLIVTAIRTDDTIAA